MRPRRTGDEVLAAIARIAPVIEAEAAPSEAARRATPALVEALHAGRLFRLWIPGSIDGDELDLPSSLRAFEAVSRIDGSAGNPYDNAKAESFIKTLKVEEVYLMEYDTFEEECRRVPPNKSSLAPVNLCLA